MKSQIWVMTASPVPSCTAYVDEAARLKGKSVTVERACCGMGNVNRNRLTLMAIEAVRREFAHLCPIGGYVCAQPKLKAESALERALTPIAAAQEGCV